MYKLLIVSVLTAGMLTCVASAQDNPKDWPEDQEAVAAAPQNHKVLYEDDDVRLLSVTVRPGELEPMHHHGMSSVLMITSFTQSIDHYPDGSFVSFDRLPSDAPVPTVLATGPQPPHALENVDSIPFRLYRLEFKNLEFKNLEGVVEQLEEGGGDE